MALEILVLDDKQPYEQLAYSAKVRQYMSGPETIDWVGAVVYESGDDPDVTPQTGMLYATAYDATKYKVSVWVMAGTGSPRTVYRIRVRWTTTQGGKYELEIEFGVEEKV